MKTQIVTIYRPDSLEELSKVPIGGLVELAGHGLSISEGQIFEGSYRFITRENSEGIAIYIAEQRDISFEDNKLNLKISKKISINNHSINFDGFNQSLRRYSL